MADVAAHAGVSTTSVSLVLNNREATRISAELADRVRAAAKTLGYRPNLTARALSTQKTHTIGFVSDFLTRQRFEGDLLRGSVAEARREGLAVVISETDGDIDVLDETVAGLLDRQVDGLILAYQEARPVRVPTTLQAPIVVLNAVPDRPVPYIVPDESEGARRLIETLFDQAAPERVAVIGDEPNARHRRPMSPIVRRRLDAIWDVFTERGVEPIATIPCEAWELEDGEVAARELLGRNVHPDAVVCLNDRIAVSVYRTFREAGIRIPEDCSVVSFDDAEYAAYLDPPLTTLALPFEEMSTLAVQLVTSSDPRPAEHLVSMPLRSRGSIWSAHR